jgi:signal transduction histidine kinase/ligand-binding sensor domain-containing protein
MQRAVGAAAFLCLLALEPGRPAAGQEPDRYQRLENMHHTAWTARDGLGAEPTSLAQTTDGYLWIGTANGLFRFDGVQFERFRPERGALVGVAVSALAATPEGGLWVGHTSGGVTFITADGDVTGYTVADSLPIGKVRSLAIDHDGAVWAALVGGVARWEDGRWERVRANWNYCCRSAWKVFVESDGTLWVAAASTNRILFLPKGAKSFIDLGVDHSATSFAEVGDSAIAYVHDVSPTVHLVHRGPTGATEVQVIPVPSWVVAMDADGGLWTSATDVTRLRMSDVGSAGSEALIAESIERVTEETGLTYGDASDILIDREGTVWVTNLGGLNRFRRRNVTWQFDPSLQSGASLITDVSGEVWILSYREPFIRRARDGATVIGGPRTFVDNGHVDHEGGIWLSTEQDLWHWKEGAFTTVPPPRDVVERGYPFAVIASTADRTGRLWASVAGSGVYYLKDATWTFVPVLGDRLDWAATSADTDAEGRVWLLYRDELAVIRGDDIRVMTRDDGLDLGALHVVRASGNRVWVGGELGLAMLHGERFHRVQVADGGDFGYVSTVVPTEDGVWLSAGAGIVHISGAEVQQLVRAPDYRIRYDVFDLESDLPDPLAFVSNSRQLITGAESGDGVLWFLTNRGVVTIDPRRITRNPLPPPVVIRSVVADGQSHSPRGPVSLPPLSRTLRIEYSALSLVLPERIEFRHRLEGWEDDWHDAGTRRDVTYTDLKPGRYTFRVAATNNDGVWNDAGAALSFTVAPAWFQTIWFQVLVLGVVVASSLAAYRLRVRRVAAMLTARFDDRLAERTRIARELHDTLLQTVQGSKLLAEAALDSGDSDRMRVAMERVTKWLGQAVAEGRGAVAALRTSTEAVNDLADAFRAAADDNPVKSAALIFSVVARGAPRDLHPIARDEIYHIGYEVIRNVCAHAKATRLEIELDYAHDLVMRISDNGVGIDPDIVRSGKPGHYGLRGMRERASTIGATLSVDASPAGTRITLVVPGQSAFRAGSASHDSD